VKLAGFWSELVTNKELRGHIKTQPSYHRPGPPYTYQEPKLGCET
jgi:hypothetical protein